MFTLFQRKRVPPSTGAPHTSPAATPKGLTRPESAASLLATPRRRKLLVHIWQRTSLSRPQFASLYRAPLERYAELVQQFPASESHHHAYPGGMLDHGLEIVAYALKLRQSYLLPAGASPETQVAQAEAWTAGTAYAALLHDIGKIAVDLHVEYEDGSRWHPWHGPLTARPYRFRYVKDREYRLHSAATGLLYSHLLDREILDWLSGFPDLWSSLLYVLAGQYEHAGLLGELVVHADQASVAQELGGDPSRARLAPKHALQRKLLDGLRYLLKEELRLNQREASDGWLTQDALWLVSKTVCDKLRAHLLSQGIEGVPERNIAVFNVLQDHGIVQATPDGKAIWRATVVSDSGWTHSFTFLKVAPALLWEVNERPPPFNGTVRIEENVGADRR
jgi:integrating conjugative element relaxase (TIGR03760 family)